MLRQDNILLVRYDLLRRDILLVRYDLLRQEPILHYNTLSEDMLRYEMLRRDMLQLRYKNYTSYLFYLYNCKLCLTFFKVFRGTFSLESNLSCDSFQMKVNNT